MWSIFNLWIFPPFLTLYFRGEVFLFHNDVAAIMTMQRIINSRHSKKFTFKIHEKWLNSFKWGLFVIALECSKRLHRHLPNKLTNWTRASFYMQISTFELTLKLFGSLKKQCRIIFFNIFFSVCRLKINIFIAMMIKQRLVNIIEKNSLNWWTWTVEKRFRK